MKKVQIRGKSMELSSETIHAVQCVILDIYKEFKILCEKHNLRYFAIGGTCIGAIRHSGFIPWDDDMDVAMPFEDYVKLLHSLRSELNPQYELLEPYSTKHYIYNFIKIHKKDTAYIENSVRKYKECYTGIWLDIMPIYGMPRGKKQQKIASNFCDLMNYLNRMLRYERVDLRSLKQKIVAGLTMLHRVSGNYNFYLRKLERQLGVLSFNNSDKIIFGWRDKPRKNRKHYTYQNVFEFIDFSDYEEINFEDTKMRVPVNYDRYLKMDFGNYMKLPPLEKRRIGHNLLIIDLEKSYKSYK